MFSSHHGAPRALLVIAGAVAVTFPAAAFAGTAPPRPAAGFWRISSHQGFTLKAGRRMISGLHIRPAVSDGCGTATITVLGAQALSLTSRGGYSNWIVGHGTKAGDGLAPIKVRARQSGHVKTAKLSFIWDVAGYPRDNDGYLSIGSSCSIEFSAEPAR